MSPNRHIKPQPLLDRESYKIGIICALQIEANAVQSAFDHLFLQPEEQPVTLGAGNSSFTFGTIGRHHVVLACIGETGNLEAIDVSKDMEFNFPRIKLCLLVGICAIVPQYQGGEILLGDVIISKDIVHYTKGKQYSTGLYTEHLPAKAHKGVARAIQELTSAHQWESFRGQVHANLNEIIEDDLLKELDYQYPGRGVDFLYNADYLHIHHNEQCADCGAASFCQRAANSSCEDLQCCKSQLIRPERRPHVTAVSTRVSKVAGGRSTGPRIDASYFPNIYAGKIASGDVVLKDGRIRDNIARLHGVAAIEMEGIGVSSTFPTVVIKAGCDYADSHKNKRWQKWAAMTAASCAKAFIHRVKMDIAPNVKLTTEGTPASRAGTNEYIPQTWLNSRQATPNRYLVGYAHNDVGMPLAQAQRSQQISGGDIIKCSKCTQGIGYGADLYWCIQHDMIYCSRCQSETIFDTCKDCVTSRVEVAESVTTPTQLCLAERKLLTNCFQGLECAYCLNFPKKACVCYECASRSIGRKKIGAHDLECPGGTVTWVLKAERFVIRKIFSSQRYSST